MNAKRYITALIGFPLVAIVLILGNVYVVDIAFSIIAILAIYEYFDAFKVKNEAKPIAWVRIYTCCFHIFNSYHTNRIYKKCLTTTYAKYCSNTVLNGNSN